MNNLNKNLKPTAIPYKYNSEKSPSTPRGKIFFKINIYTVD